MGDNGKGKPAAEVVDCEILGFGIGIAPLTADNLPDIETINMSELGGSEPAKDRSERAPGEVSHPREASCAEGD